MGQSHGVFTESELQDYKDLTYFTKKEILHAYKRFRALAPDDVGADKLARISMDKIVLLPELKMNPFKDRMCKIFSSSGSDGALSFEDFLDLMSVFSVNAPRNVKTEYAFRIFDFDEDDMLGKSDIHEIVQRLTKNQLSQQEVEQITKHILQEADLDEDEYLAYAEFEHVISKSPDFMNSFCIRL